MDKIMWIDLEMTGLDVDKEVIIEVAVIITDKNLTPQDQYHAVVKQPQHYIDNMDDWNTRHHTKSGLVSKIPNGLPPEQVEKDLMALIEKHFPNEMPIIAGNSISQDRTFINKYFKNFANKLHYRMLDVSSWKLIFRFIHNKKFEKSETHKAMDDIKESIAEMKYYLSFIDLNK